MEISEFISAVLPSLFVGVVMYFWERRQRRFEKEMTEKEENRSRGELVKLDLTCATAALTYATAMAVKRGNVNGELETAITNYETAMESFRKFEREQMVKE